MKIVIVIFLVLILLSLGSALFYLMRDKGGSNRTVKALTLRIGLSLSLFLLIMARKITMTIFMRAFPEKTTILDERPVSFQSG